MMERMYAKQDDTQSLLKRNFRKMDEDRVSLEYSNQSLKRQVQDLTSDLDEKSAQIKELINQKHLCANCQDNRFTTQASLGNMTFEELQKLDNSEALAQSFHQLQTSLLQHT